MLGCLTSETDYVYFTIKDYTGIRSSLLNTDTVKYDKYEPKIYFEKNIDAKKEVPNVKRPTKDEYVNDGKNWVYTLGVPAEAVDLEGTDFYIVAYEMGKYANVIKEHLMVGKRSDGTFRVNRAPRVMPIKTGKNKNFIGFHVEDYSGISKVLVRTKKINGKYDVLGNTDKRENGWNGTIKSNWSYVAQVDSNQTHVVEGITETQLVDKFFKNRI